VPKQQHAVDRYIVNNRGSINDCSDAMRSADAVSRRSVSGLAGLHWANAAAAPISECQAHAPNAQSPACRRQGRFQHMSTQMAEAPGAWQMALRALADKWRLFMMRGLCALLFGLATLVWGARALATFVVVFGAYAVVDGMLAIVVAVTQHEGARRGWLVVLGLAGIGAGALSYVWPEMTTLVLLYLIAGWVLANGVTQIVAAVRLRRLIGGEWVLLAAGTLSTALGVFLFASSSAGAVRRSVLIAAYAILHGMLLMLYSLRLRDRQLASDRRR
jgi:uncharacterized membrane protein HdeD (DUF308 family)